MIATLHLYHPDIAFQYRQFYTRDTRPSPRDIAVYGCFLSGTPMTGVRKKTASSMVGIKKSKSQQKRPQMRPFLLRELGKSRFENVYGESFLRILELCD